MKVTLAARILAVFSETWRLGSQAGSLCVRYLALPGAGAIRVSTLPVSDLKSSSKVPWMIHSAPSSGAEAS